MRDLILTLFCALLTALTVQAQCTLELNAVNITHPVCPAESTGSIVLEATGGTPPYQYLWSNGFTGAGQGFLQAGTYSITLVDADGCTLEQVYELVPSLIADAGPDQTIYCGGAVEIGTLPADPGRIWLDGSAVPVRFEQENGTLLEFGFTNAYVGTNIPIPNPPNNPDAVKLAIESAQAQPGDQICLPVTAEQFTGLAAFSFTLNYDNNYLQLNAIQQLNEDIPGFDLSAHFTEVEGAVEVSWAENNSGLATLSEGDTLFLICLTVIGVPRDLTYTWTGPNGFTDDDPITSVAEPGNYILMVTDNSQSDCMAQGEVIVGASDDLSVQLPDTLFFCEGQPLNLSAEVEGGSGIYEYNWSNNITSPTQTVAPAAGAIYGLTVTTDAGCSGQDSVVLFPSTDLEIQNFGSVAFCEGDPFLLAPIVTGGVQPYAYFWSTGATENQITIFQSGAYSLTVTDANGCATEKTMDASVLPTPVVELPAVLERCPGESTTLLPTVTGGIPPYLYSWNTGASAASITVAPQQPSTYSVTVTENNNGCFGVAQTFIDVSGIDADLEVSVCDDNGTPADFSDDTFTFNITVSGGGSGSWVGVVDGAGETGLYGTEYTFGPYLVSNGDVQLVLNDSGNPDCILDLSAPAPTCAPAPCVFESVDISVLGCDDNGTPGNPDDDTYDIEFLVQHTSSAGEGYQVDLAGLVFEGTYGTPLLVSGLIWPLGTYAVDIVDLADPDCEVSSSFNITGCDIDCNTDDWNVVFTTIDPICFGSADGCASVEVLSGGAAPYIFTWSNGATTSNLCNLFEGVYAVTITDANGCEFSEQIFINEPIELQAFIQEEETPRCESSTDGVLSITIAGGSPPYTYVWSDGTFGGAMVGLSPGIYSVTAVDANGCAVTTSYNLQPELIADAGPAQELTCANSALVLDGSSSDTGPDITYDWTTLDGTIVSGFNTLNPIVEAPGTYILLVTDNSTPGCFSDDEVIVTENIYEPSIIADLISCDSADILFAPPLPGGLPTWTLPDGSMVANENPVGATQSGTYYLLLEDVINGCVFQDSLVVDLDPESCTTIAGRLVLDTLADCTPMPEEPGLSGWLIAIDSGDELYYAVTQANGHYEQQVPVGNYEVYPIMPATYWLACQDSYMVNLDEPGSVATLDIPVQEQETCPELTVDFSMPLMRACWTRSLYIHYCNDGTALAEDAFIEVTLDELFSYQSASAPLSGQDGQTFTFDLGDIEVNECGTLVVTFVVSCEASLGQALCAEAKIFPNTLCAPADPLWTGASLVVESNCVDDEVRFTVRNTGTGNMEMPAACIVIEDGVMLLTAPDSLELDAGAFFEYSFPANGSTYRLEIEQVPLHPGNSQPISVVEGCGENEFGSFSTGFVNQFNLGDADGFIDIECREVVASYDPNDKHGFPRGYGSENLIYPAVPMEYLVNFQNTGNDTAFLVVIRDTISEHLDMTSLRPGASSHNYTWDIDGDNVLVFTFENILLPDSTTNLEGSQGFVEYKIDQREGLPLGTVIENSAAIYFDINDPIITNTTVHKLGVDFVEIVNLVTSPGLNDAKVNIAPNPATNTAWFTLEDWPSGMRTLHLFNGQGQLVSAESFSGDRFELRRNTLTEGVYFFRISTPQGHQASGQLVWKR